jgi:hypothetical protein
VIEFHSRLVICLATVAIAISACGEDDGGETGETSPTESEDKVMLGEIPSVAGLRLPEAVAVLDDAGMAYQATSPTRSVEPTERGWKVCRTNPSAGEEIDIEARIQLVVAKPGKCE